MHFEGNKSGVCKKQWDKYTISTQYLLGCKSCDGVTKVQVLTCILQATSQVFAVNNETVML